MEKEKIKVLIGDDTANYGIRLASALRERGLYAITRRKGEKALLKAIISESPDVVRKLLLAQLSLEFLP